MNFRNNLSYSNQQIPECNERQQRTREEIDTLHMYINLRLTVYICQSRQRLDRSCCRCIYKAILAKSQLLLSSELNKIKYLNLNTLFCINLYQLYREAVNRKNVIINKYILFVKYCYWKKSPGRRYFIIDLSTRRIILRVESCPPIKPYLYWLILSLTAYIPILGGTKP